MFGFEILNCNPLGVMSNLEAICLHHDYCGYSTARQIANQMLLCSLLFFLQRMILVEAHTVLIKSNKHSSMLIQCSPHLTKHSVITEVKGKSLLNLLFQLSSIFTVLQFPRLTVTVTVVSSVLHTLTAYDLHCLKLSIWNQFTVSC